MSELHSVNWYCERAPRPPMRTSCAGTMNRSMPGMRVSWLRRRSTTRWVGMPSRSASGLRLMNSRPWLTEALNTEPPTEDPTPATAGSASTMSRTRSCSSTMDLNEMSGEARVEPKIRPVSSCGKKPFGVLM